MKIFLGGGVGRQLGLAFGAIVVCVVVLTLTAWLGIRKINTGFAQMVDTTLPVLTALGEVNDKLQLVRTSELKHLAALTMPAKDREEAAVQQAVSAFNASVEKYHALSAGVADPQLQQTLSDAIQNFHAARSQFLQMSNSAAGAEGERAVEAADYFNGDSQKIYQGAYDAVQALWKDYVQQSAKAREAGMASVNAARWTLFGAAAVVVVLSVLLSIFITRNIVRQLGGQPTEVAAMAARIASADLSAELQSLQRHPQSIAAAMARMQSSLASIVASVRSGAHGVATASFEIAQGNLDLSNRTEAQASALEQTTAAMAALRTTVQQNDERAQSANQLASEASKVALLGGEEVGRVVQTMKGIHTASQRISDITSVIDGIAFQTNILALNAAVEAARAGEQGRGFAVVASEVRSLASRSAEAAREIKQLIGASVEEVGQGTLLADQAGTTMTRVVESIRSVTRIMADISAASGAQNAGVMQVGASVAQIDQATQQNAALVEQMAAAAGGLRSQADALVHAVSVFQLQADVAAPGFNARMLEGAPTPLEG